MIFFHNVEHNSETKISNADEKKSINYNQNLITYLDSTAFSNYKYIHYYSSKSSRKGFTASERTNNFVKPQKITKG